ncbi:MAG: hypothetical protein VX440_00230 [Pseudomonadota bacterium]|nr:hypothetical protein [Pseudomonadota bacterium]|tara:strand:+ start:215 stop:430 length:216 start_codon:yes stop_codon:yes gene_type:complete
MAVPPLGKPPRFLGLKITSNRIESVLVLFVFICLSLIFLANNMINFSKVLISIGVVWSLYLWIIKKPERPY